jgi:hypothetical protein
MDHTMVAGLHARDRGEHASAEDVAQLGSAIEADKLAMTTAQNDMNQKTSENDRLKKEYDIYAD